MNLEKLNPWNWFKHEDYSSSNVPVNRGTNISPTTSTNNHPMVRLQNEIDQLFEDTFRNFGFPSRYLGRSSDSGGNQMPFQAKVNIGSDDKNYHINLEAPGLTENDISLDINENILTIRGEKKEDTESKDRNYYRIEHTYGSFQRVLALPDDVDQDGINATMKNGMLNITVPRREYPTSETKQIPINT